jgi:hypothetical protein
MPRTTRDVAGVNDRETAGIVMVAVADLEVSPFEVAVTVTVAGVCIDAGVV